jgi:hypothetical protein
MIGRRACRTMIFVFIFWPGYCHVPAMVGFILRDHLCRLHAIV